GVNVWTVNEEADMRRLLALGVTSIITDVPDRLRRVQAGR
ncbi:MAG: glycerophosphodiester phosphodiesterase family protein, partial [Anaerolineae bacterium]